MSRTVVVIPCYNEASRLRPDAFASFVQHHSGVELRMVDDGSRDDTLMRLFELSRATNGRISVQRQSVNGGKAEAVRQGLLAALASEPRPQYVGYWDADLATPLEDIPRFVQVLEERPECRLVMGARIPLLGHRIHRTVWRRRIGRVFATLASWALAMPVYDTQCGAKLLRATPPLAELLAEPFLARWIFDVELMARLVRSAPASEIAGVFYEYALDRWQDVSGSRLKLRDFADAPRQLAMIYWKYGRVGAVGGITTDRREAAASERRAA